MPEKRTLRSPVVAIIGSSSGTRDDLKNAYLLGKFIAERGWVLLNGGMEGVMEASAKGAHEAKGITVGILPCAGHEPGNPYLKVSIATNMGHARNVIIAHSADILVAIGGGEGTLSEIAVGLKIGKRVIGLQSWDIPGMIQAKDLEELKGLLLENLAR